jgi:hypothetical protein
MAGSSAVKPEFFGMERFGMGIFQRQQGGVLDLRNRFSGRGLSAANQEGGGHQVTKNSFQQVYYFSVNTCKIKINMPFRRTETSFVFPFPFLGAILPLL